MRRSIPHPGRCTATSCAAALAAAHTLHTPHYQRPAVHTHPSPAHYRSSNSPHRPHLHASPAQTGVQDTSRWLSAAAAHILHSRVPLMCMRSPSAPQACGRSTARRWRAYCASRGGYRAYSSSRHTFLPASAGVCRCSHTAPGSGAPSKSSQVVGVVSDRRVLRTS